MVSRTLRGAGCANKNPQPVGLRVFDKTGDTYFRAFGTIIGSESLTTVFGMGTGVTFPISSPEETRGAIKPPRACWLVINSSIEIPQRFHRTDPIVL